MCLVSAYKSVCELVGDRTDVYLLMLLLDSAGDFYVLHGVGPFKGAFHQICSSFSEQIVQPVRCNLSCGSARACLSSFRTQITLPDFFSGSLGGSAVFCLSQDDLMEVKY